MTGDMLKMVLEGLYISLQIGRLLLIWEYQFASQVAEMCFANDLEFLCTQMHTHTCARTLPIFLMFCLWDSQAGTALLHY